MVTLAELQAQRNRVEFLRLQFAEQHLIDKLNENKTYVNTRIRDLEKSDCEFRAKIVDLHTEIQDLKDELSAQGQVISGINGAVKEWKTHAGCFHSMQKVSDLIDELMTSEDVEADTSDVVVRVAFLELP